MPSLTAINLPLRLGVDADAVIELFGEPEEVFRFVQDRTTYSFAVDSTVRYDVSCTVHNDSGLIFVSVLAPTPRRNA